MSFVAFEAAWSKIRTLQVTYSMTTSAIIFFSVAWVFYLLTWKYIGQLVHEVNRDPANRRVSFWRWHKGWRIHRELFPASPVRLRLLTCLAATVGLSLIAFIIEARDLFAYLDL